MKCQSSHLKIPFPQYDSLRQIARQVGGGVFKILQDLIMNDPVIDGDSGVPSVGVNTNAGVVPLQGRGCDLRLV